jgi:MFS family permease
MVSGAAGGWYGFQCGVDRYSLPEGLSREMTHSCDGEPAAVQSRLLVGLLIAVTLHAFDELAIATALPLIVDDLGGYSLYGAAFSAYVLTNIIAMVWGGAEMDVSGPARPFIVGLILFAAGLMIAIVAPTMEVLVVARAVQGLGGGIFGAIVFASINKGFDEEDRPRAFAYMSAAWVIPALIAPAAAGAIAEFLDWRLIFVFLIPFVLATAALTVRGLRELGPGGATEGGWSKTLDAVRIAAGAGLGLYALSGEITPWACLLAALGFALAVVPARRLVPPGQGLDHARLKASLAIRLGMIFGFFGVEAFLPLLLIEFHGLSAFVAGLFMTSAALSWTAAAFSHERLVRYAAPSALTGFGGILVLAGIALLLPVLEEGASFWIVLGAWAISGFGMGLAYNILSTTAMNHTLPGREGATSTASGVSEALGFSLAAGFGGAILNLGERAGWGIPEAVSLIWIMCVAALVPCTVAAFLTLDRKPVPAPVPE